MKTLFLTFCIGFCALSGNSQNLVAAANRFIVTLEAAQKVKAVYPFDSEERYNFHFFPKDDRKGISMNELTPAQKDAAMQLLKTSVSTQTQQKAVQIMKLENVLRVLENRKESDHYRDSGNYYFIIFGVPGAQTNWGWRFEGHHISFTFAAHNNKLVAATPAFMGANPAIVRTGPQAGKQVLKAEADKGFALLHSLSKESLQKALIDTTAPNEIITFVSRKAVIEQPAGLLYSEMTPAQQQLFLQLIGVYVHRYTKLFAEAMLKEIQAAGLEKLRFAWAGATEPQIGKAHYYRIQGPSLIIEYDNSQNGANHVHSVVRDLKHDFGGDLLEEHYKTEHKAK